MRSKLIFLAPFAFVGCYKATGVPEICTPVVTSWGSPVFHCASSPMAVPVMPPPVVEKPVAPPPPKTEVTNEEIKLKEKVEFETDSAKLLPSSTPLLDEVVTVMKQHPEIEHVRVGGHTDSTGDKAHNVKLSDDRAASVKQYLVDHGIAADRLASKGYGESRPIADNKTEEGRAQNRRVDIHILRHKGEKQDKEDK
jgi:outer membrane protein OmpA-like peptidoglycan-associated protein